MIASQDLTRLAEVVEKHQRELDKLNMKRRTSPRHSFRTTATCQLIDCDGEMLGPKFTSEIRDISAGGLSMLTPQPIERGYVCVSIPHDDGDCIDLIILVTRHTLEGDGSFIAGRFVEL